MPKLKISSLLISLVFVLVLSSCSLLSPEPKTCDPSHKEECLKKDYDNSKLKSGNLKYQTPESWISQKPANRMRLAQFETAAETVLAVYFLRDLKNAATQNVNRWKKQFIANEKFQIIENEQFNYSGLPVTTFYASGDYQKARNLADPNSIKDTFEDFAMLAAIVETEDGMWFFKSTGPKASVEQSKASFDELLESFEV